MYFQINKTLSTQIKQFKQVYIVHGFPYWERGGGDTRVGPDLGKPTENFGKEFVV